MNDLISRDKLRETLANDSWSQSQEFKTTIIDNDRVICYSSTFNIDKQYTDEELERFFIAPARLAIVREFVKRRVNVQIGQPHCQKDGTILTVSYPVVEESSK